MRIIFIIFLLTVAITFSCSQKINSVTAYTNTTVVAAVPLINETTFEDAKCLALWGKELPFTSSLAIIDSIARKGRNCARFQLAKTDPIVHNGSRAEITLRNETEDERWYGMSMLFPAEYVKDEQPEIVAQWHETPDFDLGETWRSPPISLWVEKDRFKVVVKWATEPVNTNKTITGEKEFDLGPVNKNEWVDWVFHIKYSFKKEGILEVYKNKSQVLSYMGPNSYNDEKYPYFKIGVYKWPWSNKDLKDKSETTNRVLFVDEIRVANKDANLYEVSPK